MGFPKLGVGNVDHPAPKVGLSQVFLPGAQMFPEKSGELRSHPCLGMNAIGNARYRNFMFRHTGPDILPKRAADIAVQFAHAVRVAAHAQRQNCHAERIGRIDARLPEAKKFLEWNLQFLCENAEVTAHHVARERIVTSRYRRMSGENVCRSDNLKSGIKIQLSLDDVESNTFEREEGGVSFVHVEHLRVDPERDQRFHATDPEHNLLTHSPLEVAAIKFCGDQTVLGVVLGNVGVEQVKTDPANLELPNLGENFAIEDSRSEEHT